MSKGKPFPHERRLQGIAYGALAASAVLAFVASRQGADRLFGVEVPAILSYALLAAGALAGLVAVLRRMPFLALAAILLLVLGALPGGMISPGLLAYATGLAFAGAALAYGELVHMMGRYEAAHRAVESDGLPEDHLNRVTDEALATLAGRVGLALALAGAGVALALLLSVAGPAQWRAALETTSPLGVALASLALLGLGSVLVLLRGARPPWRRPTPSPSQELAPDVAD
jgi:hypothetical protein